jgi:Big-like domain-containing protein
MRARLFLLLLTLGAVSACGQGTITILSGGLYPGFSGDGGPATAAQIYAPRDLVVDASGNIYFADSVNVRIRKIDTNGIITTIAGNGVRGFSGDGGPASAASLGFVDYIALDPTDSRLCLGDTDAWRVRCITLSTGIIQTIAGTGVNTTSGDGGPAVNANLYTPAGMTFDPAGNLYFADSTQNRIRRIDTNGIITTYAGTGLSGPLGDGGAAAAATFSSPSGLRYKNGALYVADLQNYRVRRIDLTTNAVTTIAGNGVPYYAGDGGPATSAQLTPQTLTFDTWGNMWVSDALRVRKIDLNGIITTAAGDGYSGACGNNVPATQTEVGAGGLFWDPIGSRLLISEGNAASCIHQAPASRIAPITLNSAANPSLPGDAVAFTIHVWNSSAPAPTGQTQLYRHLSSGDVLLGSAPLNNGLATINWTPPGLGTYSLFGTYLGDAVYMSSGSSLLDQSVQQGSSTTTLTSSVNPSNPGQAVTLTATVSPSRASGTVQFMNGGSVLGSATLSNGTAALSTSQFSPGSNSLTAQYGGDSRFLASASPALTQVVRQPSSTSLSSNPNPSTFGNSVTLTVAVTPSAATGTVQFFNGATLLGSATLAAGSAQFSTTALPAGSDSLTAVYSGDANDAGSTSPAVYQTVNKAASTTTLTASPSSSNVGQLVTFIARVTPTAATGAVQFLDGSSVIGTVTLSNGTSVFQTSTLSQGTHSIRASYLGDSNVNASQSSALSYRVKH